MVFFFFNDTATTEIYTLSLHDALPIYARSSMPTTSEGRARAKQRPCRHPRGVLATAHEEEHAGARGEDRKSTRLNSSHSQISHAVFCLQKKILLVPWRRQRSVGIGCPF